MQPPLTILGKVLVQGCVDGRGHAAQVHVASGIKVAAAEAAAQVQCVHGKAHGQAQVKDLQGNGAGGARRR